MHKAVLVSVPGSIGVWRPCSFASPAPGRCQLLLALEEFCSLGIQFSSYQENIDTTSPLGQALFTVVAEVAQLERNLIRERVSAGIRSAREKGQRLGRPRVNANVEEVLQLKPEGPSLREIAANSGLGMELSAPTKRSSAKDPRNATPKSPV
jgi:DNA invertase Pin-like site-specific DNA recombinase